MSDYWILLGALILAGPMILIAILGKFGERYVVKKEAKIKAKKEELELC